MIAKEMQGKRLSGGLVEAILKELRDCLYHDRQQHHEKQS